MPVNVVIRGLERVQGKFGNLQKKFPKMLEDATMNAVLYVHKNIPKYPAQPSGSSYRRTGTLGRTITSLQGSGPEALSRVDNAFGQVRGIVGTKLSYAPFVIDKDRQSVGHKRNGWWNLQDVVKGLRSGIKSTYAKALDAFLRKEF